MGQKSLLTEILEKKPEPPKPVRPSRVTPCREYIRTMQRLSWKCFGGNYEKFQTAKTTQERLEVEKQRQVTGDAEINWDAIDHVMIAWAKKKMGETSHLKST